MLFLAIVASNAACTTATARVSARSAVLNIRRGHASCVSRFRVHSPLPNVGVGAHCHGDAGREQQELETVVGTVEQVNSKQTGVKVSGEWLNVSQYHPLAELPRAGQRVEVEVERTDRGAWIVSLQVLDGGLSSSSSATSTIRELETRRLGCLQAAATFAAGKCVGGDPTTIRTADVLKVAGAFERWVVAPQDEEDSDVS